MPGSREGKRPGSLRLNEKRGVKAVETTEEVLGRTILPEVTQLNMKSRGKAEESRQYISRTKKRYQNSASSTGGRGPRVRRNKSLETPSLILIGSMFLRSRGRVAALSGLRARSRREGRGLGANQVWEKNVERRSRDLCGAARVTERKDETEAR